MINKLMKGVILAGCLCLALMSIGCGGGGGGGETAPPTATEPPAATAPPSALPTVTLPKNYTTLDELAADMKTPEALGAWMVQNISYLYPLNNDMANWKYLSPNEVFSGRQGDCIHRGGLYKRNTDEKWLCL